ncbi:MAG: hypothetical protein ACOC71_02880 [Hyphomicrobiales bacterium]
MADQPVDYEEALKDPAEAFETPGDVVTAAGLTREQKIEILKRWESDARLLMVASEENMPGGEPQQFQAVQEAMRALQADPHEGDKDTGSKFR